MKILSQGPGHSRRNKSISRSGGFRAAEPVESRILMSADAVALRDAANAVDGKWFEHLRPETTSEQQAECNAEEIVTWNGQESSAVSGEWIVQFSPDSEIASASDAVTYFQSRRFPATVIGGLGTEGQMLVRLQTATFREAAHLLKGLSDIQYAEPNFLVESSRIPDDPYFPLLTGLQQGNDQDIDAEQAWNITAGSSDVVVGVIDTGVDYTHPDLAQNIWVNPGEIAGDGIDNAANGFVDDVHGYDFFSWDSDPLDEHGHGTHVAGTIAAVGNNGIGTTGVTWNSKIMAIRMLGPTGYSGSMASIVAAVNYATMMKVDYGVNVRVTNNSWGGGSYSKALSNAIQLSAAADIVFVAAAGNNGSDNDSQPAYPASYDAPNIISVAAVDNRGKYADFTNYGATTVDVAAPGVDILSTVPGGYAYSSGTSMAAPHVAGVVALAAAANPELNQSQLKRIVLSTGTRLRDTSKDTVSMRRVNAFNAVRRATIVAGPAEQFAVFRPDTAEFYFDTGRPGYQNEKPLQFGLPGDQPVTGDWDGDGRDDAGVYRVENGYGYFYLDTGKPAYDGELPLQFGLAGDLPVAGDWDGNGVDEIGVFRPTDGLFYLDTGAPGYQGELPIQFGLNGDLPVTGDWDGNGVDEVGVFRPTGGLFYLDTGAPGYQGELPIQFGLNGDLPVVGDWDGNGNDDVGVFRPVGGLVLLDRGAPGYNGETAFQFGLPGDRPLAGRWMPRLTVNAATSGTQSSGGRRNRVFAEVFSPAVLNAHPVRLANDYHPVQTQQFQDKPVVHADIRNRQAKGTSLDTPDESSAFPVALTRCRPPIAEKTSASPIIKEHTLLDDLFGDWSLL